MIRRRTFTFEGWIVSVVPGREVHQVRWPQEAAGIVRSAEREGGTGLLFDILGLRGRGHLGPASRAELRQLVAKEVLVWGVVLRQPLRETIAYARPETVDLRDLIEPTPLVSNAAEPVPSQSVAEPEPWIEFEVVDSRGRRVSHFRATLNSSSEARVSETGGTVVRHDRLPSASPVSVTLKADPNHRAQ